MSGRAVRSLQISVAITFLLSAGWPPAIAGQAPPDFGGILGAILNSALRDQARSEWQNRPIADYSCLEAHNLSADQLAANGVSPNDPRVQKIFAQCAQETARVAKTVLPTVVTAANGSNNPNFVVDGLAVGATVHPDSPVYKAYKCRPSDQFPAFTWCAIRHPMTGKFGPFELLGYHPSFGRQYGSLHFTGCPPGVLCTRRCRARNPAPFSEFWTSCSRSHRRPSSGRAAFDHRLVGRRSPNPAR